MFSYTLSSSTILLFNKPVTSIKKKREGGTEGEEEKVNLLSVSCCSLNVYEMVLRVET